MIFRISQAQLFWSSRTNFGLLQKIKKLKNDFKNSILSINLHEVKPSSVFFFWSLISIFPSGDSFLEIGDCISLNFLSAKLEKMLSKKNHFSNLQCEFHLLTSLFQTFFNELGSEPKKMMIDLSSSVQFSVQALVSCKTSIMQEIPN